ncbi:MAG: hypothetical protein AB9869_34680 [Verrucomicrobiia bacterium]
MNSSLDEVSADNSKRDSTVHESSPTSRIGAEDEIDGSLLEDSLAKSPWERMQANDDALRFADTLRAAVKKRDAKPERIDAQTG